MDIDIVSTIDIPQPRDRVAGFAADPARAPEWYVNIRSVEWRGEPGLRMGARMDFVARFLGRRLAYTYEVVEYVPGELMTMKTAQGPFPMETRYTWDDLPDGGTRMTLRNRGRPSGFAGVAAPLMSAAVGRANRKDLRRLKTVLEG